DLALGFAVHLARPERPRAQRRAPRDPTRRVAARVLAHTADLGTVSARTRDAFAGFAHAAEVARDRNRIDGRVDECAVGRVDRERLREESEREARGDDEARERELAAALGAQPVAA